MRSFFVAGAALIGSAAANPFAWGNYGHDYEYNPYPTDSVSSSSSVPSSTVVPPIGGTGVPPSPSGSSEYPHPPLPTGGSKPPHPPYSTGVSPPPTTDTLTTYTTETVCPVTKTYGTQVVTTLTTSIITVTCKGSCHHQPTYTSAPPTNPEGYITKTETITTSTYTWVPCSTAVGQNGPSVIYSTYLTASYYPTTYVTEKVYAPTDASQPPVVTPPTITAGDVPSECPPPLTVTVTVNPQNPQPCHYCETKTYTVSEGGYTHTFTTTFTPTDIPTYVPHPPYPTSDGSKPPVPTGGSSLPYIPSGTGYVPYPTYGHDSSSTDYSSGNVGPVPTGYGYEP